jgi:hypothetical protein
MRNRVVVDKVYGKLEMKGFDYQQQARAGLIQDLSSSDCKG